MTTPEDSEIANLHAKLAEQKRRATAFKEHRDRLQIKLNRATERADRLAQTAAPAPSTQTPDSAPVAQAPPDSQAQLASLRRKLEAASTLSEQRFKKFEDLRDRHRDLTAMLKDRNTLITDLRSRNRALNHARRDSWLSHFVMLSGSFSTKVLEATEEIAPPGIVLAHEDLALRSMLQLSAVHPNAQLIFDNVEFPDHRGRIRFPGSMQERNDDASNASVLAFKTSAINATQLVFASSPGQAKALGEMGVTTPVEVLHNCRIRATEGAQPSTIRQHCGLHDDERLVLYLNNAYEGGGADETIAMLDHLPQYVHVAFLGNAKLGDRDLSEVAAERGLSDRCSFLDLVPSSELVDYIRGADLITIPLQPGLPNFETCLPNRVFEAIAAQVPMISHEEIAIGEFITEHGLGCVFSQVSATSMAIAVEDALDRDMSSALAAAAERFTWEVEQQKLKTRLAPSDGPTYLLANKGIERNNRIFRLSCSLADNSEVHVFARGRPADDLVVPGVIYHEIGGLL